MSVPKWKQTPNEQLDLFTESNKFAKHIVEIAKNEKIFLPQYKTEITDRLIRDAIDVYTYLWKANLTSIKSHSARRLELQKNAYESLTDFICVWGLAKTIFHLRSNKDVYVMSWAVRIKTAMAKWISSDVKRAKPDNIESDDIR